MVGKVCESHYRFKRYLDLTKCRFMWDISFLHWHHSTKEVLADLAILVYDNSLSGHREVIQKHQ